MDGSTHPDIFTARDAPIVWEDIRVETAPGKFTKMGEQMVFTTAFQTRAIYRVEPLAGGKYRVSRRVNRRGDPWREILRYEGSIGHGRDFATADLFNHVQGRRV